MNILEEISNEEMMRNKQRKKISKKRLYKTLYGIVNKKRLQDANALYAPVTKKKAEKRNDTENRAASKTSEISETSSEADSPFTHNNNTKIPHFEKHLITQPEFEEKSRHSIEYFDERDPSPQVIGDKFEPPETLWYYKENDLHRFFPVSPLWSLKKSFMIGLGCIIALVLFGLVYGIDGFMLNSMNPTQYTLFMVIRLGLVSFIASLVYWEVYRRTYIYKTEGFRFIVCKGVFIRHHSSIPLLPVNEVHVVREGLDYLLGLYKIKIIAPLSSQTSIGIIEGLGRTSAFGIAKLISEQLDRQVFITNIPEHNYETGERTERRV
jgi:membrane protein YdbS with pleckstrin-like domain